MSLTNTNNTIYNVTLDGLTTIDADVINVNGQTLDPSTYVTYTNATQDVHLGSRKISSYDVNPTSFNLINKTYLDDRLTSKADLTYVNSQDTNLQNQINTKAEKTYVDTQLLLKADKTYVDTQLLLKADKTYVDSQLLLKADKTYVDTNLSLKANSADVTAALALKADSSALSNYLPLSGGTITGDLTVNTRILGTPDGSGSGNFWIGLKGSDTETNRLAIAIIGAQTTGTVSKVSISKPLYLDDTNIVGSRVLVVDSNKKVASSIATITEIGYLSGVTNSIQTQLNEKASTTYVDTQDAKRVLLAGDTMTGHLYNTGGSFHPYKAGDKNKGCILFANNADGADYTNYNGGLASWFGIGFQCTNDSTTRFIFNTRDGNSKQTGQLDCGSLTTAGTITTTDTGTSAGVLAKRFYLSARGDNQDEKSGDEKFGPWYGLGDSGISGFTGKPCLAGFYGCALRSGLGYMVLDENGRVGIGKTDPQNLLDVAGASRNTISGTYADTTAYHIYTTTANHYDGNASTTYLMSGLSGYLTLANKTTRTDGDACIMWGTNSSISEVNSVTTDGSDLMPLNFGGSSFLFSGGNVTISNSATISGYLYNRFWATGGDYRNGIAPNLQGGGTMGYYFGRYANGGSGNYSDMILLNGWGDGSAGSVNLIAFNKGDKGIRQFQGTHGSATNMSTYYDCVMTDSNSSNVTLGGKLITGGTIVIKNNVNSYEPGCIYTDVNWGMLFRGAVVPNIAHMRWDASDGTMLMKIQNTGVLSFNGGGTNYAVESGFTTRAGALCIGNISTNYGGGWQAGLMMECQDTTEISCHDSGNRLTSFIYYDGGNRLYIGRDIGWGATPITLSGSVNIESTAQINTGANQNFLTLNANSNNSTEYINLRFSHSGNSSYIQSYRPSGFWRVYLGFYTVNSSGNGVQMFQITDQGIQGFGNFYTPGNSWCGDVTNVGNGCATFSQNWDRVLIYANGYNTAGGYFYYNQGNAYGTISDRRIKKDFERIDENQSIEFIKTLEPTSFCLKEQTPCCRKGVDQSGNEMDEEICPAVCSCRQEGWIAQNVLDACKISGASKSVVNNWFDYEQELNKPEEEQKTLIGVSDRPILSHTVNVVKYLLNENDILKQKIEALQSVVIQQNQVLAQIIEKIKNI